MNSEAMMVVKARKGNSNLHTDGPFLIVLLATSVHFKQFLLLKWRILSRTSTEQSGKNEKKKKFPTGLQVHLEDMF